MSKSSKVLILIFPKLFEIAKWEFFYDTAIARPYLFGGIPFFPADYAAVVVLLGSFIVFSEIFPPFTNYLLFVSNIIILLSSPTVKILLSSVNSSPQSSPSKWFYATILGSFCSDSNAD